MSQVLTDFSEAALIRALEINLWEVFAQLIRFMPGSEVRENTEGIRFATGIPHPLANGMMRTRFAPEAAEEKIAETLAYFQARSLPMLWWTCPSDQPADLGTRLQNQGLAQIANMPGMAIDLEAMNDSIPMPQGVRIEEVGDTAALQQWTHALTVGYEIPPALGEAFGAAWGRFGFGSDLPLRNFLAAQHGKPVSCASLYLDAGVAGIYCVATVPEARRQGIAAALVLRCLQEARALGYRIGTLQSSQMGEGVYRRLGFQECCKVGMYAWPGQTEEASGAVHSA
ncbi:MAG TPA: GNAT family N-acetyltransferase [Chthonomonadaceae bacterium]|nr:GNAT family N-acetyltransferase [Chthonomonadaceae bacterium]